MGTQQILLIVLSVIIVGVAIAVGITMFRNQAINANAQAIAAEATNMRTEVVQFFKTPIDQGGGGGIPSDASIAALETKLGLDGDGKINKANMGEFQVTLTNASTVGTIGAIGLEKKDATYPVFFVTFDTVSGDVDATATGAGFGATLPTAAP